VKFLNPIFISIALICDLSSNHLLCKASTPPAIGQEILRSFFTDLLETTSAGYVIYGEKPIYLGNYCRADWLIPGTERHKESIQIYLSLKLLNSIPKKSKQSNCFLTSTSPEKNSFIITNRKSFFNVIQNNLVLFKYKFGHNVIPVNLLDTIINSEEGFSNLFENEIALQGILLGYGTDNSISYERASVFTQNISSNNPPSPPSKLPPTPINEEEMVARIEIGSSDKNLWEKVKQETKDFTYYHPKSPSDNLKIPFSFHKNSADTKNLLKKYQKAQSRVNHVLTDRNFLERVLEDLQIDPRKLQKDSGIFSLPLNEEKSLSQAVARSLKYTFSEQISPEFFKGMKAAQTQNADDIDWKKLEFFEILRERTLSLNSQKACALQSQRFLQKAENKPEIHCLVPKRLYFTTIKKGFDRPLSSLKLKQATIKYSISDINNNVII